jgi:CDP-diacylglycerol--serine O-phosphatidyltransferase
MPAQSIPKLLKLKDYITLIGTSLGILALICAVINAYTGIREILSLGFFLVSITLGTDMIDGYIARKTKTMNEMGRELDSLSDSLTFGIAPAILTFQAFRTETLYDVFLIVGSVCFALGAVLRLARFNISKDPGYTGVPTPISAYLMIAYFYANYFYAYGLGGTTYPFLDISSYLIPIFMILIAWFNITTYFKFGEKGKTTYIVSLIFIFAYPVFGIIGIITPNLISSLIATYFFLISFLLIHIYIIRGFILQILEKRKDKNEGVK